LRQRQDELCRGQIAFLSGDWDDPDDLDIMEDNRIAWLTPGHRKDPEQPIRDGSPGPAELWRKYGKAYLQEWRRAHSDGEPHPAEEWLGPPDEC
jgi:hypothetical protein